MAKKLALGKGLGALIGEHFEEEITLHDKRLQEIDINLITPNVLQPRKYFDEDAIAALAESITRNGVIQPLLIHEIQKGYEIIAGERRWRAAKKAGLKTVPAIVMSPDEQKMYEMALIENMQRQDLNPIEEAHAFQSLISSFDMKQQEVAAVVGKSRSYIANTLRLLQLADEIQQMIIDKKLTAGHAKILVGIEQERQLQLANLIVEKQLNVRESEALVNKVKPEKRSNGKEINLFYQVFEKKLEDILGSRVKISERTGKGSILIEFYDHEDFERIFNIINQ